MNDSDYPQKMQQATSFALTAVSFFRFSCRGLAALYIVTEKQGISSVTLAVLSVIVTEKSSIFSVTMASLAKPRPPNIAKPRAGQECELKISEKLLHGLRIIS